MTLRYGSLFSGYGGLDMGVQSVLGGETAWHVEFDKHPSAILAHHYPDVPNYGDVTKVDWSQVEPVDVLTGGFPCQDVSHAGRRAGLIRDGEGRTRSGLWGEMLRAITELRPRLVVAENVRGLLSAAADSDVEPCPWCLGDANGEPDMRALGAVLADLADVGYDAWWVGLRAADVGAAHGRFRVFIFATPADRQGDEQREPFVGMGERAKPRRSDPSNGLTLLPTPVSDNSRGLPSGSTDYASLANVAATLLPTPRATDGTKGGPNQRGSSGDLMLPSAVQLLPTPRAAQGETRNSNNLENALADLTPPEHGVPRTSGLKNGDTNGNADSASTGEGLRDVREASGAEALQRQAGGSGGLHETPPLFPELREQSPGGDEGRAPLASEAAQGGRLRDLRDDGTATRPPQRPQPQEQRAGEPGDTLRVMPPETALARGPRCPHGCGETCSGHSEVSWGDYEAAIRRWEVVTGRPAPDPTEPGSKGNPRLSAHFVEFLMGLPEGHVTGVDIPRNAQLKALGNGVVPQQAAAACRWWLTQIRSAAA